MITKELFIKFIDNYKIFDNGIERMSKAISGSKYNYYIWETDWAEAVGKMLDFFVESHFTESGQDVVFWWLFEDIDHIITQTVDPDLFNGKSEIEYNVNDIEDLWNYLVKYKKDYFKDE